MANIQNVNPSHTIVTQWKQEFRNRIKGALGSRKRKFTYQDAVVNSFGHRNDFDAVMLEYVHFMANRPLRNNDFYKYIKAYRKGRTLKDKYFKHDPEVLHAYYAKVDKDPEGYDPFNFAAYESYVLYMVLKLQDFYKKEYDILFNVTIKDHCEYNPISKIPSVLRAELPFSIKEYDIIRAYPTFIDIELGIKDRARDVYGQMDKITFNTLINMHKKVAHGNIEKIRDQLKPIYGNRTNEVMTENRFHNQGQMFRDLVVYEEKAIVDFVDKNQIKNFVIVK